MARLASAWVWFLAAVGIVPALLWGQNVSVMPLVPAANWRLTATQGLAVDEIKNYGGDAAVEREYGVKSFELRTYQLDGGRAEVVLEPAADVSAAFGLFTYYQNESMHPEKAIQLSVTGPGGGLMARGRTFIRFLRPKTPGPSENEFRALLILVGGTRPTADSLTNLPAPLPPSGLVPGTEKYIIGPVVGGLVLPDFRTDLVGFNQGAELQVGQYTVGGSRATMLEMSYPTPQISRLRFSAMNDSLGLNQDHGPSSVYGRREGSFVFLVRHAESKADATKLLDQFKVTEQLSWDEKYPGDKTVGRQLFELIMGNVLLSLGLAGGGIVGGVLLVCSRRAAAKLFPTWDWGNPEGDRLIRLNLD
jgi:hypothetical protein